MMVKGEEKEREGARNIGELSLKHKEDHKAGSA